jgi:small nuclear ribonucleoprotein F
MASVAPGAFMQSLVGKRVVVKSKWGTQYVATLVATDAFMNLLLSNCAEHAHGDAADNDQATVMPEVLLRCNNVLYIREVPEGAEATIAP